MTVDRTFARLSPAQAAGPDESERIYTGQLIPLARELFQSDPRRLSYETLRVVAEHRSGVGWTAPETAWRFTVATQVPADDQSEADRTAIPESMREQIARLTELCCRDLHRLQVNQTAAWPDDDAAPASGAGAVLVLERAGNDAELSEDSPESGTLVELSRAIAERGARVRVELVVSESETRAIREPGQIYTGALLPASDFLAVIEIDGSDDVIGDVIDDLRDILERGRTRLRGYRVERTVQFARSRPAHA